MPVAVPCTFQYGDFILIGVLPIRVGLKGTYLVYYVLYSADTVTRYDVYVLVSCFFVSKNEDEK